ncbi:Feather keratin Cos1-1/Cos1-3/Cos2-1, partial [Egretta garzetta]
PCQPCGLTPLANSCNEPCVRQCQNSTVVIEPPAGVAPPPPAAVGSILSCQGVPITSGCCDLSCITSSYYGNRCHPC